MLIQDFKKEVKNKYPELFTKSTAYGIWLIIHAWGVIFAAAFFYSLFQNLLVGVLVVMKIGRAHV